MIEFSAPQNLNERKGYERRFGGSLVRSYMDSLARARKLWDEIIHSGDCWDDEDPGAPEAKIEGIARHIATAIDEARLEEAKWWDAEDNAYYPTMGELLESQDRRKQRLASLRERGKM